MDDQCFVPMRLIAGSYGYKMRVGELIGLRAPQPLSQGFQDRRLGTDFARYNNCKVHL